MFPIIIIIMWLLLSMAISAWLLLRIYVVLSKLLPPLWTSSVLSLVRGMSYSPLEVWGKIKQGAECDMSYAGSMWSRTGTSCASDGSDIKYLQWTHSFSTNAPRTRALEGGCTAEVLRGWEVPSPCWGSSTKGTEIH